MAKQREISISGNTALEGDHMIVGSPDLKQAGCYRESEKFVSERFESFKFSRPYVVQRKELTERQWGRLLDENRRERVISKLACAESTEKTDISISIVKPPFFSHTLTKPAFTKGNISVNA